jgi:hypothetical protein
MSNEYTNLLKNRTLIKEGGFMIVPGGLFVGSALKKYTFPLFNFQLVG